MPAISEDVLDTVVYLYPDAASAAAGERAGGSGCVVVIPMQQDPFIAGFAYIVTNSHVIRDLRRSITSSCGFFDARKTSSSSSRT
jgi:hypothetical protein